MKSQIFSDIIFENRKTVRGFQKSKKNVIPANAGISCDVDFYEDKETPAFAGVTDCEFKKRTLSVIPASAFETPVFAGVTDCEFKKCTLSVIPVPIQFIGTGISCKIDFDDYYEGSVQKIPYIVIPANAGISYIVDFIERNETPAFAGVTVLCVLWTTTAYKCTVFNNTFADINEKMIF